MEACACDSTPHTDRPDIYIQNITDNKKFWKTVKPLLSEKSQNIRKITIIKDGEIISRDEEVAETLNSYFKNAVTSLDIKENELLLTTSNEQNDSIDYALKRYESHPSILNIYIYLKKYLSQRFLFQNVTLVEVENELQKLKTRKSSIYSK